MKKFMYLRFGPGDAKCIADYIIEAESFESVEKLAAGNPFISSIRISELRAM